MLDHVGVVLKGLGGSKSLDFAPGRGVQQAGVSPDGAQEGVQAADFVTHLAGDRPSPVGVSPKTSEVLWPFLDR